jgi:hypothetical protein
VENELVGVVTQHEQPADLVKSNASLTLTPLTAGREVIDSSRRYHKRALLSPPPAVDLNDNVTEDDLLARRVTR